MIRPNNVEQMVEGSQVALGLSLMGVPTALFIDGAIERGSVGSFVGSAVVVAGYLLLEGPIGRRLSGDEVSSEAHGGNV